MATSNVLGWMWNARPGNTKTGKIPTAYIGESLAESKSSCKGCPLLGKGCYAWKGSPKLGMGAMVKAATGGTAFENVGGTEAISPGGRYSLDNAIANRHKSARAARIGALGDPSRVKRSTLLNGIRKLRDASLAILAYTHFWRLKRNSNMRLDVMASCDDTRLADEAIDRGWIPAAIINDKPEDVTATVLTPAGNRLLVCPAQQKKNVTCNDCRMCDPKAAVWESGRVRGIAFCRH